MNYTNDFCRRNKNRLSGCCPAGCWVMQVLNCRRWAVLVTLSLSLNGLAAQVHDNPAIELSGFSVSEAFKIPENEVFDLQESNFQKLLYRTLQTSVRSFDTYAQLTSQVTWDLIRQQNPEHRTAVFQRKGTVTGLERLTLPETEAGDPVREVFRLFCQTDQGDSFQIISLDIPRPWIRAANLQQPIGFTGFLYTLVASENPAADSRQPTQANSTISDRIGSDPDASLGDGHHQAQGGVPMFVCKTIAWYPVRADADLGVAPAHVLMAEQGVDIAGIDLVMRQHGKKLTAIESPYFFQFLAAIPQLPMEQLADSLGAMELLQNFRQAHGQPVRFQARVRQCAVVQRPAADGASADSPSTDSFSQYYQLIVFPDLSPAQSSQSVPLIPHTLDVMPPIEVTDGGRKLTYSRFPFTICARSLPDGLSPAEIENRQVWVEGIFYRFWKYESEYTNAEDASGQLSPLIIVNQPRLVEVSDRQLNKFINGLLLGFLAIFLISGWTAWRLARRRHYFHSPREDAGGLPDRLDTRNFD
jgi:hypothetical protein